MSRLAVRAERIKIEVLLEKHSGELDYLDRLSVDTLSTLREQITTVLFEGHASMFRRLANAGGVMPLKIRTLIAEKALGATLCARVAGYTEVERAVAMAEKLHVPFLADVAARMDPHRAQPLLRGISEGRIKAVAKELARRADVITLGRFMDALPVKLTVSVMADMDDDAAVLRGAFFVNNRSHLQEIIRLLSEDQLRRIIATAREQGLYRETLALLGFVDVGLGRRLADLAAEAGLFEGLVEAIHRENLWSDALPVARGMSPESRQLLLRIPRLAADDVLAGLLDACEADHLWEELEGLAPDIAPEAKTALSRLAEQRGIHLPAALRE